MECPNLYVFLTSVKSVDPDEMLHYAVLHLGLHCLPMYLFRGFQYAKD